MIHMFNIFFTVLQNLMAFVEKLQPVEKVDFEWCRNWDPQFWQKFWRLQVYEKGHNRGSFVVGVKWKEVSFDVRDIFSQTCVCKPLVPRTYDLGPRTLDLGPRTPYVCSFLQNATSDKSLVFNCSLPFPPPTMQWWFWPKTTNDGDFCADFPPLRLKWKKGAGKGRKWK